MGRRRVGGVKPPKEKPELKEAPEVQELAARLIDNIHTHLAEARIKYLFRTGKWELRGRLILGKAEKVAAKWKYLTDYDFVVTINRDTWFNNSKEIREAILDHELTHCSRGEDDKQGNPKWYIMPHTVEDFVNIIQRHGLWTTDLQHLKKASDEYEQLTMLPGNTGTEG
ncbi:MAG TPA: putative metallopeptidase [Negativicutes bacterium]|nr:putative metallopeptidase [Negativicutes bacterium]